MRKRYSSQSFWVPTALGLALFLALAVWVLHGIRDAAALSDREGLRMAERAVRQAAASLYALEGAYPPSYEELRERSGIAVDEEKYEVYYSAFASNLMPEISVYERGRQP